MVCAQMEEVATPQSRSLHWLDINGAFLTEDGSQLRSELQFDGTHMAPAFLQHVGAAVDGVYNNLLLQYRAAVDDVKASMFGL